MDKFLPICRQDMEERGWNQVDFTYVSGDAYVDHPSFGTAIISRVLEAYGYKVGIIAQPDSKQKNAYAVFGEPRLGFLVSAGNMDSMVNHYTVAKKKRKEDAYSPGGVMGKRPDYATISYCQGIRKNFPNSPIIIGGIEASLRRLAHYDYWSDKLKPSILIESGADILSYGMGEKSIVEIAEALDSGLKVSDLTYIKGTVCLTKDLSVATDVITLPSYVKLCEDKKEYAKSFMLQIKQTDPFSAKPLAEKYKDVYVLQNPPAMPLSESEMDRVYSYPYQRTYHPSYESKGGIPAISEVKFSLICNRGCFGACHFCALTFHQGRIVQTRSKESLIQEATMFSWDPEFKGYIHDVGGPTADFFHPACEKQLKRGACKDKQCLFPKPCKALDSSHTKYLDLLRELRALPKVKKVFIRSGIRFDYVLSDSQGEFFNELCEHHVSGQLKVAPEHVSNRVLNHMGKPEHQVYQRFYDKFKSWNEKHDKKQYLVPYLMSSHPGSTLADAIELALYVKKMGTMPEQVQDFYPTPSTISTVMYYTGLDPSNMKPIYVPKNPHEKAMQRALIQYRNPKNYQLVKEALVKAGREDLIGFSKEALIRPRELVKGGKYKQQTFKREGEEKGKTRSKKRKPIRNVHKKKAGK